MHEIHTSERKVKIKFHIEFKINLKISKQANVIVILRIYLASRNGPSAERFRILAQQNDMSKTYL